MHDVSDLKDYSLAGKLLISMPHMVDPRLEQSVIYVCGHDVNGAMGLIINRHLTTLTFQELLIQLDINTSNLNINIPMYQGGPLEIGRGFVLHTDDYITDSTVVMTDHLAITATLDTLKALAQENGPKQSILALGYVGWIGGQLDQEYHNNAWISINATPELVFNTELADKWRLSMASIGIDPRILALDVGHA